MNLSSLTGWDNYAKFGSARFGYARNGVYASLSIADAAVKAMLEQTTKQVISCYPIIKVDGTDISSSVFYTRITLRINGSSDAELHMKSDAATITAKTSIVTVDIRYITSGGGSFEVERFRGKAETVETKYEDSQTIRRVDCYDTGYYLQTVPPFLGTITEGTFKGLFTTVDSVITTALIAELAKHGFAPFYGSIGEDGVSRSLHPNRRGKAREFINSLAGTLQKAATYFGPGEVLRAQKYDVAPVGSWAFPLSCQTKQEPIVDDSERVNCVRVSGVTLGQLTSSPFYTYSAKDDADIAARGVLFKSVSVPEITFGDEAIAEAYAEALIAYSQLGQYKWTTPLHAYVHPLEVVTLSLRGGSTASVMVEEVTDVMGSTTGRFDGAWSNWKGRAIA